MTTAMMAFWVGAVIGFFAAVFIIGCRQLAIDEARESAVMDVRDGGYIIPLKLRGTPAVKKLIEEAKRKNQSVEFI